MSEVHRHDPSIVAGNSPAQLSYIESVTLDMLRSGEIPKKAAIDLGYSGEMVRPFSFGFDEYGAPSIVCLNDRDDVTFMPIVLIPGLDAINPEDLGRDDDEIIVAFRNRKQFVGLEDVRRVGAVLNIGFGVQEGHRGREATESAPAVPPEKPGFYLRVIQIGTAALNEDVVTLEEVGIRNFSLARTGALGDPMSPEVQEQYGLH